MLLMNYFNAVVTVVLEIKITSRVSFSGRCDVTLTGSLLWRWQRSVGVFEGNQANCQCYG